MPDCINCVAEGRTPPSTATHRMVLRGKCVPSQWGTDQFVHVDYPSVTVCWEHAEQLTKGSGPSAREAIGIVAKLQQKAIQDGRIFDGRVFNYGFAELEKSLGVAAAEMAQQFDQGKVTHRIEGAAEQSDVDKELARQAKDCRDANVRAFARFQAAIPEAQLHFEHGGLSCRFVVVRKAGRRDNGEPIRYRWEASIGWGVKPGDAEVDALIVEAKAAMADWPAAQARV